ncbi:tyrosine-protein kinase Fer [Planoprotostelium fungivorum]|uniref:Tyrosine-protein kinase Fer n=1 Tax=Planoprotostelium fungivorum TaxID=1890364 RepID=A0A2P6MRG4_9EUKA|nr:tyrosine-protein kinase Fer [Planoprotostelium fungivorum]
MRGMIFVFLSLVTVSTSIPSESSYIPVDSPLLTFGSYCNITVSGLPGDSSWSIGRPLNLNISLTGGCPTLQLYTTDPWATDDASAIYYHAGSQPNFGQRGGLSKGFYWNIVTNHSLTLWPIDGSHWVAHAFSQLWIYNINTNQDVLLANTSVVRRILHDFSCKQLSPFLALGQIVNLTCSVSYSGDDTFYNVSVWLKDGFNSSQRIFFKEELMIDQRIGFTASYAVGSVPEGPNGIRVQTWLQYDSWTYNSTLYNYPQTLYLSGDINPSDSRGYNTPFNTFPAEGQSTTLDYYNVTGYRQAMKQNAYLILTNPALANDQWVDTSDHTGDENSTILLMDPYGVGTVFTQTFTNLPRDTRYVVSFYVLNLNYLNDSTPPLLRLSLDHQDGNIAEPVSDLSTPTVDHPHWYRFSFLFKTRTTNVTLRFEDYSKDSGGGNDFAFDDLSLYPVDDGRVLTLSHEMNITSVLAPYNNGTGMSVRGSFGDVNNLRVGIVFNNTVKFFELDCQRSDENSILIECDTMTPVTTGTGSRSFIIDYHGWNVNGSFIYRSAPITERLNQLITSNVTVSDAEATDMMNSLMNVSQSPSGNFFQLLDDLTTVMLRGRDNYNLTAGSLSLSGIKVDKKNASVDLSAGRAQVKITGQVMSQILKEQNRTASVIMSATAVNTLSALSQTELYSDVVGLSLFDSDGNEIPVKNTEDSIVFTLTTTSPLPVNSTYECLYFAPDTKSWNNISTQYDDLMVYNATVITCSTNHLTNFSVGVKKNIERGTVDKVVSTTKSAISLGMIIGPAIGGSLFLLLIIVLVVFFILRRKRRATRMLTDEMVGVDVGQVFSSGSIRVGERISGRVYRGHPEMTDAVALKKMTEDSELKNKREVQAYLRVRHPQIVQYLSTYTGDAEYMVMTYMPMGTLLDYVRKKHEEEQLTKILTDVLSGLRYMHENDLVHCNLSASKVLLNHEGNQLRGKICSLGYSRRPCVLGSGDIAELSPRWMAPELLSDGRCTYKSDVWSFGMMLYECMSGRQPYSESREEEVRERVERGPNLQPAKDWPVLFARVFTECIKRSDERPEISNIIGMLREGADGSSTKPVSATQDDNVYY